MLLIFLLHEQQDDDFSAWWIKRPAWNDCLTKILVVVGVYRHLHCPLSSSSSSSLSQLWAASCCSWYCVAAAAWFCAQHWLRQQQQVSISTHAWHKKKDYAFSSHQRGGEVLASRSRCLPLLKYRFLSSLIMVAGR
jgi:hypothetical protein